MSIKKMLREKKKWIAVPAVILGALSVSGLAHNVKASNVNNTENSLMLNQRQEQPNAQKTQSVTKANDSQPTEQDDDYYHPTEQVEQDALEKDGLKPAPLLAQLPSQPAPKLIGAGYRPSSVSDAPQQNASQSGVWDDSNTAILTYQKPSVTSYQSVVQLTPQQIQSGEHLHGMYDGLQKDTNNNQWIQITGVNTPYWYQPGSTSGSWINVSQEHPTLQNGQPASEKITYSTADGNIVNTATLQGYNGQQGYISDNDIPTGYHLDDDTTNGRMFTFADGSTINKQVEQDTATDTLNYMYAGHVLGSFNSTGTAGGEFSPGAIQLQNFPSGFKLADPDVMLTYPTTQGGQKTDAIQVEPAKVVDTLTYMYNGIPLDYARFEGVDSNAGSYASLNGVDVGQTSLKEADCPELPPHFSVVNPDDEIPLDGQNHYIPVEKTPVNEQVDYQYKNVNAGSTTVFGQYGEQFLPNAQGLNPGYQIVDPNQQLAYESGNVVVPVEPIQTTDHIAYTNGRSILGVADMTGDDSRTNLSSSSFKVGSSPAGLPVGYQVNDPNQRIQYDGQTHVVSISPANYQMTVHLNYVAKDSGMSVGSQDINESAPVDTAFDVDDQMAVPTGYELATNDPVGALMPTQDGTTQNVTVYVKPQQVTDTINYMYDNVQVGSVTMTGAENTIGSATGANLPSSYSLPNDNTNQFTYDGGVHDISVNKNGSQAPQPQPAAPSYDIDTINYVYDGNVVGVARLAGTAGQQLTVGSHPSNLPDMYKVSNPNAQLPYDNESHDVPVELNEAAPVVCAFVNQNNQVVGYTQPLKNLGIIGQTVNITPQVLPYVPHGYHMDGSQAINVKLTDQGFAVINF